jgi:hypothetical protein
MIVHGVPFTVCSSKQSHVGHGCAESHEGLGRSTPHSPSPATAASRKRRIWPPFRWNLPGVQTTDLKPAAARLDWPYLYICRRGFGCVVWHSREHSPSCSGSTARLLLMQDAYISSQHTDSRWRHVQLPFSLLFKLLPYWTRLNQAS